MRAVLVCIFTLVLGGEWGIAVEEKKKMELKADQAEYHYGENAELTTILRGNVICRDEKVEIYAQRAEVYREGEKIIAEQKIKVIDRERNLTLTGEKALYEKEKKYIKITGSPVLSSQEMEIKGEVLEILGEKKIARISGGVNFSSGKIQVSASSAVYYDETKKIEFAEKAKIWKKNEVEITGEKISFYLNEKKLVIEGKVKALITPRKEKKEKKQKK
jgi:lipopolysaccharide export system protein LptA